MKQLTVYLTVLLFILAMAAVVLWPEPVQVAESYVAAMGRYSWLVFVAILVCGVVFAPATVMPVIPLGTAVFGPFLTGVLSVIGWTIGGTIAFLLARHLGRPLLGRWINLDKIDVFVDKFPPHLHFWWIVFLRHTVPVDILSYALGLSKAITFKTYFFATLLGVTYFSFAFAYIGEAIFTGNTLLLIELGLASVAIFLLGWYLVSQHKNKS